MFFQIATGYAGAWYGVNPFDQPGVELGKKLTYAANRTPELAARFADPSTQLSVTADLNLIDAYDTQIAALERHLVQHAKIDEPVE